MTDSLHDVTEGELYELMGSLLLRSLPEGWATATLEMTPSDRSWRQSARAAVGVGDEPEPISLVPSGSELSEAFAELRRRMAESGDEGWSSAQLSMSADGKFDISFAYSD